MCTSLTLETKDGHHLFARTMDFTLDFNQSVIVTPRRYAWKSITGSDMVAEHAAVGMGIEYQGKVMMADGLNDAGLACACLYFPGFATYNEAIDEDKINLAPFDFVFWCLAQFDSVEAVRSKVSKVNLMDIPLPHLNITPPLHWILTDKSGACIVIEPTSEGIKVYDNPVGVMTNSPEFGWHLQNLRQYIGLRPQSFAPTRWGNLTLNAFGQGSGSVGLPGDYTPPSRFVRAAYWKQNITTVDDEKAGITAIFHILSSNDIPKGVVVTADGVEDFTRYSSAMCLETGTYYYHTYDCRQITAVHLFNEDLDSAGAVRAFPFQRVQLILDGN